MHVRVFVLKHVYICVSVCVVYTCLGVGACAMLHMYVCDAVHNVIFRHVCVCGYECSVHTGVMLCECV